jgi:hypothetical protein
MRIGRSLDTTCVSGSGAELALRHPGFGVLGFQFPRAEAEALIRDLQAALDGAGAAKPN